MRTNTAALRVALLTALGLVGCGGESRGPATESTGGDGTSSGGRSGSGGAPSGDGGSTPNVGGSRGQEDGGSGGMGAVGGSAGAPVAKNPFPCNAPTADGDPVGNTETCAGGLRHRAAANTCVSMLPRPTAVSGPPGGCTYDADCTAYPNGYCTQAWGLGTLCEYGCLTDSDCGASYLCDCGSFIGTCVKADCKTDADCSAGLLCTAFDESRGCNEVAFACQTRNDACGGNDDCSASVHFCSGGPEHGTRTCSNEVCVTGRPLCVAGAERVAAPIRRNDWRAVLTSESEPLSAAARRLAAEAWTRAALTEHASIATFARFVLELSAFGSPPELIERAIAAQRDELGHAREAFELASRFAGHGVGPGPLDVNGCLAAFSLEGSVEAAVLEGCAGETLAALEAEAALAGCHDAGVHAALTRVRREEAEHAELAFRFVAWALAQDARLAAVVECALQHVVATTRSERSSAPERSPHAAELLCVGILSDTARQELRAHGVSEVVAPCVRALLAAARANGNERALRANSRHAA